MARRVPFPPSSIPAYIEQSMKLFVCLRGKALIDLGPFLEREFVDLDFARLATTTGGIC